MKTKILTLTIAALLPATWSLAQNDAAPRDGQRKAGQRDGERPKGTGPRDGQREPGVRSLPFLHALDVDDDGIISAGEIKDAPAALKKLDRNQDGKLTRDEWRAGPAAAGGDGEGKAGSRDGERPRRGPRDGERPRGGPRDGESPPATETKRNAPGGEEQKGPGPRPPGEPVAPLVEALDADRDGVISAGEIDKSPEALAKLDKNADNQLGPREYGARAPQGPLPRDGEKPAQ